MDGVSAFAHPADRSTFKLFWPLVRSWRLLRELEVRVGGSHGDVSGSVEDEVAVVLDFEVGARGGRR